ncbi:hypothetical protein [Paenibacillus sp. MBLB4367]|uniref:hypothetical protein n=1 Tax=Paenibacillus sp. MBLB4367 TaxID=3384767 RepID=UPI0039080DA2
MLAFRNDGSEAVGGVSHTSGNVKLELDRVPFALGPGEEFVAFGWVPEEEEFTIEARSELAGVSPSRA